MIHLVLSFFFSLGLAEQSTCYGTTSNGHLENGVKLPTSGVNLETYSFALSSLGRTYIHSEVRDIMISAYSELHKKYPEKVYKYAETGNKKGGPFKPHKTHRNGLSVDHMVPVLKQGKSTHLPTNIFNKYGYNIEFSLSGKYQDYQIDYESLGALIVEIHKQSIKKSRNISRVIFDPKMTPNLYKTTHGDYLKKHIAFTKKRSWVRHDEHIHIDFDIPC